MKTTQILSAHLSTWTTQFKTLPNLCMFPSVLNTAREGADCHFEKMVISHIKALLFLNCTNHCTAEPFSAVDSACGPDVQCPCISVHPSNKCWFLCLTLPGNTKKHKGEFVLLCFHDVQPEVCSKCVCYVPASDGNK